MKGFGASRKPTRDENKIRSPRRVHVLDDDMAMGGGGALVLDGGSVASSSSLAGSGFR